MNQYVAVTTTMVGLLALGSIDVGQTGTDAGDRVVLVTIDGARTQEIYGGLDAAILKSTLKQGQTAETSPAYRKFWAESPEERRRKLMPFFWSLVTDEGSNAGDTRLGSSVRLGNQHWFSYPGYAEILLGEPHDAEIKSNDAVQNRHTTVLETLRARLQLPRAQVATFASWSVFNQIAERSEVATFINAGVEPLDLPAKDVQLMNVLQAEAATPWDGTRFDVFTFRMAMTHLATAPVPAEKAVLVGTVRFAATTIYASQRSWPCSSRSCSPCDTARAHAPSCRSNCWRCDTSSRC